MIAHAALTIPSKLHMIWVGDEAKRPDSCIETWRQNHPAWEFRLWGEMPSDQSGLSRPLAGRAEGHHALGMFLVTEATIARGKPLSSPRRSMSARVVRGG